MVRIQLLTVGALLTALTAVATLFLKIPGPTGYYHLGDGVYFAAALVFGPAMGAVAGGLGGMLADVFGGYAAWAPITLIIKGLSGFIVGRIALSTSGTLGVTLGLLTAAVVTVLGYGLATWLLYTWPAALAEVMFNVLQTAAGAVVAIPLSTLFRRAAHQRQQGF